MRRHVDDARGFLVLVERRRRGDADVAEAAEVVLRHHASARRSPGRRATPCRCARRRRRLRAGRSGRSSRLTVMLSNMFTLCAVDDAAVDQQIDLAAEIRVGDVVERQPPQPRPADLRARCRRSPDRAGRSSRSSTRFGLSGFHAPSSGRENVVDDVPLSVKRVPLVMFVVRVVVLTISAGLPATLTNFSVPLVRPALSTSVPVGCLVPTYTATRVGHDARAAVAVGDDDRLVLRIRVGERVLPGADAGQARSRWCVRLNLPST